MNAIHSDPFVILFDLRNFTYFIWLGIKPTTSDLVLGITSSDDQRHQVENYIMCYFQ